MNPHINTSHMNPHMTAQHQNTILLERHYIPYNLYCNMYNYPNNQSYNNFNIPNNSLFTHNNPINARYNLFNSQTIPNNINEINNINQRTNINQMNNINQRTNNEEINIRRPIIPNPLPYTLSSNLTDPSIYNRTNLYNIPIPIPIPLNTSNINTVHTETNTSNLNINRILNEVINDIPYNFEFNNRFGTIGSGGFIGTITTTNLNNSNNDTLQEEGIPLSNINLITNVARFCDIQNNNNNVDTCSICQLAFSNTIICRVINNCNHIFHINCIDTWLHNHTTCPFCRYDLSNISISNEAENDGDDEEGDYEETEEGDYEEGDYEETEGRDYEESNEENINQSQSNNTTNNTTDPIINTEPMLNDINTFVSMSTPFINSFINQRVPNSNASPTINSEQINRQINNSVNQFVNQLNPLLQSFNNFGNRN